MRAKKDKLFMLENENLRFGIDHRGRIVSLYNKATKTELITYPDVAEAWRLVIPIGRHMLAFVYGSQQKPKNILLTRDAGVKTLTIAYDELTMGKRRAAIRARFMLSLADGSCEIQSRVELENGFSLPIDEVEFPIIGGLGGFSAGRGGKCVMHMVVSMDQGNFYSDVLMKGFPHADRASDHYAREQETAMFDSNEAGGTRKPYWLDLWGKGQGLYFGHHPEGEDRLVFKLEKYPKEVPNAPAHHYPAGTPRWLRVYGIRVPCLKPGRKWISTDMTIMPHAGDWHAGADRYSAYRHKHLQPPCAPPAWMDNFVGWTEIVGKLYTGEVFHDYRYCADQVVKDKKVTGIDFVFYYGHSKLGAEGADFDHGPAPDLGGEAGFQRMVAQLHKNGIRIMLLDHIHRYVNRDLPEYKRLKLEKCASRDSNGQLRTAKWWKETVRSCIDLAGPTPEWVEMCPSCQKWLDIYLRYVTRMIELGVDGLELDCFVPSPCFNLAHNHKPGHMLAAKLAFMRIVQAHAKQLNPDFILIGETMWPESREVLDGWYPNRYTSEQDRIHRYLFPEFRTQAVLVGNYAYDPVNKAVQLGIGVETEIWGLRKTCEAACPELARYIGAVNQFKRKYADIMIRGTFRDTVGAKVDKDIFHSVLEGPNETRALVLRNRSTDAIRVKPAFLPMKMRGRFVVWSPAQGERTVKRWPDSIILPARGLVVILDL